MQRVIVPLPTKTYTAGGTDVIPLRDLPKTLFGRITHLAAIFFDVKAAPTYTTAPTVIGTNNVVQACDVWDGSMMRFQGGFNELRLREYIGVGRKRNADPDADTASATARYFRRIWHVGPPSFAGGLDFGGSDFVLPCAALETGEVRITYGALTDISADCTACTATVKPYAVLVLLDEVRIPPAYQVLFQTLNSSDVNLTGRALYDFIVMCNDVNMGAIGAGDFGTFRLDLGYGDIVPTVPSSALDFAFHDGFAAGHLTSFAGEPIAASDDNEKDIDASSPTALSSAGRIVQPVLFSSLGAKLSKLPRAESVAHLSWSGTQASGYVLMGRVLEQPPPVAAAIATKALGSLGKNRKDVKVKTLSKVDYNGPFASFMPLKVAV